MKKFLLRLCIFAVVMIVCDILVGFWGNYLVAHTKGGTTERLVHMADEAKDDVLFFGSSRAVHHYDPNIFEDTLGLPAYNCGFDGNGIICAYGFYKLMKERFNPKILVYDLARGFDLKKGDNNRYLGYLRNFYDREGIDSIYWNVDKMERYKMMSEMYRFNSVIPRMVLDTFHPLKTYSKGYLPLDKEMKYEPKVVEQEGEVEDDSLKLLYLEKLIKESKGKTKLIFTLSPSYKNNNDDGLGPIKSLCEKNDVPFISHYTDTTFNNHKEYFSDRTHLNRTGATEYSRVVAGEIKKLAK